MERIYKQFVELGTKWKSDLLLRARVKLTFAYVAFSALLLTVFSYLLYGALLSKLIDTTDDQILDSAMRKVFFDRASDALQSQILSADVFALFVILILGYFLTAFTLRPIAEARERERRFLADAAHELRMPLSVMKTSTEVALRVGKHLTPSIKKMLAENIDEIDSLTNIANGLLLLVGGETIPQKNHAAISLYALLQDSVEKFTPFANSHHITLSIEKLPAGPDVMVLGDRGALMRAFNNIIDNSLKYTLKGGVVTVNVTVQDRTATIQIVDTGIGISAGDLPYVTEAFFRSDSARTANGGSGLGLSIVSEIIRVHSGQVHIESKPNVGTTVTVSLPLFTI